MSSVAQVSTPTVPPEVIAFASGQGVAAYLPAVLALSQRLFPEVPPELRVEADPEIPDDRHIVVAVKTGNRTGAEALEARYEWHRGLFDCCPAPLVCVFRLGMGLAS